MCSLFNFSRYIQIDQIQDVSSLYFIVLFLWF